jgi:DNA mismatch repair ATPase MutS
MLVTGRNNSGKTVYLRSIGTAVLLAQCGCPVTAEFAEISVRRRIFTAFARAEGELVPLSSAGRFEEEVAEIAAIVGDMEPDSLLLLNETFQTTAYDEGAEGMAPILAYLSALGCGFIFVTHLTRLIEMLRGTPGVTVMRTSDDPRTRYKIAPLA